MPLPNRKEVRRAKQEGCGECSRELIVDARGEGARFLSEGVGKRCNGAYRECGIAGLRVGRLELEPEEASLSVNYSSV